MKIKTIKIISFVLIFCVFLYYISNILKFKDSIGLNQTYMFYKQPKNSIDVLFIGSSHVHADINPAILYKEYGISSYNLSSAAQPLLNSYFFLKESLKTQKPKLIVLEGFMLARYKDIKYTDEILIISIFGLKFSLNKINLIKLQFPQSRWNEFFNPFYQYHNRYSSLNKNDFLMHNNNYFKGYFLLDQIYSNEKKILITEEKINLPNIVEEYYRKFILLSKENDIPIIIIIAPYPVPNEEYKMYNTAEEIANEYNVPFINFNSDYLEYELDFSSDFADKNHLNYDGVIKFNKYLGKYLKENYNLPDRRGDPKYYSWATNAKYEYKRIYNVEFKKECTNLNEYIEKVKNANDYVIGITMLGNYQKNDIVVQTIVSNFNINDIYLKNASYVINNNKLIYSSANSNQYLFHNEIAKYTDLVIDSGNKLSINRVNYIKTRDGINIVIYDKLTEEIVDNIYLEYKDNSIDPTIKR